MYRRENGEPQLTFNYCRAFSDYTTNFCFGRGFSSLSPYETSAIVPSILDRVWTQDNHKEMVLWEMGNQGSVSGDVFVKVAYEEPHMQPPLVAGPDGEPGVPIEGIAYRMIPGRVRILVVNSSFVYPEWHPHDKTRLIRVKMKYRFWGNTPEGTRSVFTYTELITDTAIEEYINDALISSRPNPIGVVPWVHIPNVMVSGSPWGLSDIQDIIGLNREYNEKATDISDIINYHCVDTKTQALTRDGWKSYHELSPGVEVLVRDPDTDEIRWEPAGINVFDYDGPLVRWDNRVDAVTTPNHRWLAERRVGRPENKRYVREIVRTSQSEDGDPAAGDLREGSRIVIGGGVATHFPAEQKYDDEFVETVAWFVTEGYYGRLPSGSYFSILSQSQTANESYTGELRRLQAYWKTHGETFTEQKQRANGVVCWYVGTDLTAALLDVAPDKAVTPQFLTSLTYRQAQMFLTLLIDGDGTRTESGRKVWYQDDLSRRDAFQMLSAMLYGSRTRSFLNNRGDGVVDTYQTDTIEILSTVKRAQTVYAEDGKVWCPTVPSGIWFARREGVTYWTGNSAPVTIMTGAKASQAEMGAKKVWAGLPSDAKVYNLELGGGGIEGAMDWLASLKKSMHELTGVPEGALGDVQPISNTSGVALAIQFMPMMNRYNHKKMTYGVGIQSINRIVLLTLALKEPQSFLWSPRRDEELKEGQLSQLDPDDPITYHTECHWPPPLPVDMLAKLQEVQLKMAAGLMSKREALAELGEEFPDEKMREVFLELVEDAIDNGALSMLRAQISQAVQMETGQFEPGLPQPFPPPMAGAPSGGVPSAGGDSSVDGVGAMGPGPMPLSAGSQQVLTELTTRAYGTRLASQRNPKQADDDTQ